MTDAQETDAVARGGRRRSPPAVVLAPHVTEVVPPRTALGNRNLPFLLMISVFMLWFPVCLKQNSFLYICGFVVYFLARSIGLLFSNAGGLYGNTD
jgi:hypothetical protein